MRIQCGQCNMLLQHACTRSKYANAGQPSHALVGCHMPKSTLPTQLPTSCLMSRQQPEGHHTAPLSAKSTAVPARGCSPSHHPAYTGTDTLLHQGSKLIVRAHSSHTLLFFIHTGLRPTPPHSATRAANSSTPQATHSTSYILQIQTPHRRPSWLM